MKRLIVFALAFVVAMAASAGLINFKRTSSDGTYYYKYVCTVNSNGVKTKRNFNYGREFFVTFASGMSIAVPFTDENGNGAGFYSRYVGRNGDVITYKGFYLDESSPNASAYSWGAAEATMAMMGGGSYKNVKMCFSSDYSRLNIITSVGLVHVLERAARPEEEEAPSSLY